MKQDNFDSYFKELHPLVIQKDTEALLQLIKTWRTKASESDAEFFSGEEAFYHRHYEKALKSYLKAIHVPHFQFFCFRASAFLFSSMGSEKALTFAQKALKIVPDDYLTLGLLAKLSSQPEDAHELQHRLAKLEKEVAPPASFVSIGHNEIQELVHIFKQHPRLHEELFVEEFAAQPQLVKRMESPMNSESDIFSSPKSRETSTAQALTERLYPERQGKDPYISKNSAFEELQKLAMVSKTPEENSSALEQRIKSFQLSQADLMRHYVEQGKARVGKPDHMLYYLHGWPKETCAYKMLTEQSRKTTGGIFIRWNGRGIALNPGLGFLEHFHEQGLNIRDIDTVIVTSAQPETYAEVKEIYELNYQLNKVNQELQIIHYYFHHKAFQDLAHLLKPHFKQERHTMHSLELFMDSPEVEKVELGEGILLYYFQERSTAPAGSLGICLELKSPSPYAQESTGVRIGYIAQMAWSPLLSQHLGSCDILLTGFGNTGTSDYNKLAYNADCLGYYGTFSLLQEVAPRLLLCGEFGGREGDIRLEVAQNLRADYAAGHHSGRYAPTILPADQRLSLCLKTLKMHCTVSQEWVEPTKIQAVKTAGAYGPLAYLAPSCRY